MTIRQAHKALAGFFGFFAAAAAAWFFRLKWSPGVDFDVTGFFWLVGNAGRLSVLALFVICAGIALSYWIRAYRNE